MDGANERDGGATDPLLGKALAGQYRVVEHIGSGAMGVVYRAHHDLLRRDFAVKVIAGTLAENADARRRFLVEARALVGIVHPSVVQVRHFGEERRSVEFLGFLDVIAAAYPRGLVHVVLDHLNTRKGAAVEAWSRKHGDRFVFHYTPYHASWLNPIEVYFSILERRILKHGEFDSTKDLDAAVERFVRRWNRFEAHPFRWTYRATPCRRVA